LNRQVRKAHQVQENKDLKRVFLAEDFCSESRASTFGEILPEKDDFNRNGSAADIDELETKLFRQMDGMHADERRDFGNLGSKLSKTNPVSNPSHFHRPGSASIPSICG
jgi:hypothetical protein